MLSPIAYALQCGILYVGKIPRTGIGRPSKQRRMVLRRRNTVVRGKCALPSALLVQINFGLKPKFGRNCDVKLSFTGSVSVRC